MTVFTPQERRVVLFLLASLLAGSTVKLFRSRFADPVPQSNLNSQLDLALENQTSERTESDTVINRIESILEKRDRRDFTKTKIDINSASEAELCALPGIGPTLARRIVAFRDSHGKFRSVRGLVNVPGIGDRKLAAISAMVEVGGRDGRDGVGEGESSEE